MNTNIFFPFAAFLVVLYGIFGFLVFVINTGGPATLGLAVLRGLLWPLWLAGGLQGKRLPMD